MSRSLLVAALLLGGCTIDELATANLKVTCTAEADACPPGFQCDVGAGKCIEEGATP